MKSPKLYFSKSKNDSKSYSSNKVVGGEVKSTIKVTGGGDAEGEVAKNGLNVDDGVVVTSEAKFKDNRNISLFELTQPQSDKPNKNRLDLKPNGDTNSNLGQVGGVLSGLSDSKGLGIDIPPCSASSQLSLALKYCGGLETN